MKTALTVAGCFSALLAFASICWLLFALTLGSLWRDEALTQAGLTGFIGLIIFGCGSVGAFTATRGEA